MTEAQKQVAELGQRAVTETVTPTQLLALAVENGADLDKLEKLMNLEERWKAQKAKEAFHAAMQEFKAHAPIIVKDRQVSFSGTSYRHASHAQVATVIGAALAKVGITHAWSVEQADGMVSVTCTLTHVLGHSQSVTMTAPLDDSGKKNAIQQLASTKTYLERHTLTAVTGIGAQEDDDGLGHGAEEPISEGQLSELLSLLDATETDKQKWCEFWEVESVAALGASHFERAKQQLVNKQKRAAQ